MKIFLMGVLTIGAALADVVTDWNAVMRATVSAESPQAQGRFAAITHLAVFEAVNAITKDYKPYLGTMSAAQGATPEAAAVAAECLGIATLGAVGNGERRVEKFFRTSSADLKDFPGLLALS